MVKYLFSLVLMMAAALTCSGATPLTIEKIANGDFNAEALRGVMPLGDGESFTRLSKDKKQIVKYAFKTGQQTGVIFDVEAAKGVKLQEIDGYTMSPDETRLLIQTKTQLRYRRSKTATYYIYSIQNKTLEPLSKGGPQEQPLFSPDGNQIAFVRDNNIYLVKLLFNNSESQVTTDGKFNSVINGLPDWVNEEEFSTARSFDFSEDGKMLAWVRYDESKVKNYDMQLFKGSHPEKKEYDKYPGVYSYKYPKAGCDNSRVKVMTYDIKSHVTRTMDLPLDSDAYIPRIKFTATTDQLAIVTLNRHQNEMNIYMGNARSCVCKLILREKDERYIREPAYTDLAFYGNHFALLSDRSGYRQLYWYTTTGQLEKQVTTGQNEVTAFYGYDATTQTFYYAMNDGGPLRTAVYKTNMKGQTKKLSAQSGTNNAIFSATYKYFINEYSNITTPPVTAICNNEGRVEKTLITNDKLKNELKNYNIGQKEFFRFKTSEGVELNGWMMKPADFNANRKYPVVLYQYSGPGSQKVTDGWNCGFTAGGLLESYWNGLGMIVVCVDGRGTGGRGADFEKCTYLNLGKMEAADQVETALYVGSLPYVDKEKIGIWGWSYGGFNTLMSMSEGREVFKCGVAVAPPTDWRFYDTVYTERFMRTPGENSGYDDNPITRAGKLHGDLLICHGLADDNVHFQNTAEYSEALVQAGKQFDMQVYTNRNHSIYGGKTRIHLLTRITNFFVEKLK